MIPRTIPVIVLVLACSLPAQRRKGVVARQLYQSGIESYESGDYADAITVLSKSLGIDAKNAGALRLRGLSHLELGHSNDAFVDLSASLELNQKQADAWFHRGNLNYELGKLPEALADYSESLKHDAVDGMTWHNRALVYQDMGKLDDALNDFDSAIEREEGDPVFLFNRGFCRREYGNLEGALADLNAANAVSKADPDLLVGRAELLIDSGLLGEAQVDLDEALRLRPDDIGAYKARARIRIAQGDLLGAVADWKVELKAEPTPGTYYERGLALALLGRWREAAVDFGLARGFGVGEELTLLTAVAHSAAGEFDEAEALLRTLDTGRARYWSWWNKMCKGEDCSVPEMKGDAIFGHLRGQLDRKGLLAAMGSDAHLRSEALFFVAAKQQVDGDLEASLRTLNGIANGDGVLRIQRALVLECMRRGRTPEMLGDAGFAMDQNFGHDLDRRRSPKSRPSQNLTETATSKPSDRVTAQPSFDRKSACRVAVLRKGGPAELAGLLVGDILLSCSELLSADAQPRCAPGQVMVLEVLRGDRQHRTVVIAGLRSK